MDKERIKKFIGTIPQEAALAMIECSTIERSEYLAIVEERGSIIGVAGVRRSKRVFPSLFIVVRNDVHGKGYGRKLLQDVVEYSVRKYGFLLLSSYMNGKYENAFALYRNIGFKDLATKGNKSWMIITRGIKGVIFCSAIKLLFPILQITGVFKG